jgi:hypothetical protein
VGRVNSTEIFAVGIIFVALVFDFAGGRLAGVHQ